MYAHGIGRMPADPYGAADTGPTGLVGPPADRPGRNSARCAAHGHRTDAGTAAAVGDAERLVQVEVADVGTELARLGQADERVEVGAVDVHLTAGVVDDVADLADRLLEHAVRRGVRHHDRRRGVSPTASIFARRSSRSMLPRSSVATTTTSMPAITALAAFVPWALDGIRQTVRSSSPRERW